MILACLVSMPMPTRARRSDSKEADHANQAFDARKREKLEAKKIPLGSRGEYPGGFFVLTGPLGYSSCMAMALEEGNVGG